MNNAPPMLPIVVKTTKGTTNFFSRVEARRDKPPDLIHDEWRRQYDAADECDIQIEGEPFTRPREDQRVTGWQRRECRSEDEVADPFDEEGDQHARADREARTDDACPQLVKMLEESHPAFAAVTIGLFRQQLEIGFGHIALVWGNVTIERRGPAFARTGSGELRPSKRKGRKERPRLATSRLMAPTAEAANAAIVAGMRRRFTSTELAAYRQAASPQSVMSSKMSGRTRVCRGTVMAGALIVVLAIAANTRDLRYSA